MAKIRKSTDLGDYHVNCTYRQFIAMLEAGMGRIGATEETANIELEMESDYYGGSTMNFVMWREETDEECAVRTAEALERERVMLARRAREQEAQERALLVQLQRKYGTTNHEVV